MSRGALYLALAACLSALAYTVLASPELITFDIGLNITDARGSRIAGFNGNQPHVKMTLGNVSWRLDCFSCIFKGARVNLINASARVEVNFTISWLGVEVLRESLALIVDSSANNTVLYIGTFRMRALNIEVVGTNDEGARLGRCEFEVNGLNVPLRGLKLRCGETVTLPFGIYNVTSASYTVDQNFQVRISPLTTSFQVSNTTDSTVKLVLGVAGSYSIAVEKKDGSPLIGANLELVGIDVGNATFYKGVVQSVPLKLSNLPYGRYLARVAWRGEQLHQALLTVDQTTRSATLRTKLVPGATLVVFDADEQPLGNLTLSITGPGLNVTLTTDSLGYVTLQNVIPAFYTVRVRWMTSTIARQVHVGEGGATVKLPLRRVCIRLMPNLRCRERCSLPSGLSAEVLYGDSVLARVRTTEPLEIVRLETRDPVYVGAQLLLRVHWNDTPLLSKVFDPSERELSFELPFFDLLIVVNNARGSPLPGAIVAVIDDLGERRSVSDAYGLARVRFLYGDFATLKVVWSDATVSKLLVDASSGQVVVNTCVYPLVVEVLGVLRPIEGARVTAYVFGTGLSFNASAITESGGKATFEVPYPPGSHAKLTVAKGRIEVERILTLEDFNRGVLQIRLDILIDFGWMQIKTDEAMLLAAAATLLSSATILVMRRLSSSRAKRAIFAIYGGTEKREREEVLDRLRRIFEAEREEEEEGGLFEEF